MRLVKRSNSVGEFIAVLDTDDLWFPEKLEKQIILFDDKDVGIVISNSYFFNNYKKKKLYKKDPPSGWVADKIIPKYYVSLETLMFRRNYVKLINGDFDKRYDLIADFDLVVRLSKISKLAYVSDVLAACRIHEESDSFKNPKKFVDEKELWFKDQKQKNFFVDNKIVLKNFENIYFFIKQIFELIRFKNLNH